MEENKNKVGQLLEEEQHELELDDSNDVNWIDDLICDCEGCLFVLLFVVIPIGSIIWAVNILLSGGPDNTLEIIVCIIASISFSFFTALARRY
jgi:hypothetical protein